MNRVVKLIILNAIVGISLKSLMAVRPFFAMYHQLRILSINFLTKNPGYLQLIPTCAKDLVCMTIDTIGRNLLLVNLSIPLFFFHKFDLRFKECFKNLIDNIKKKYNDFKF